MQYFSSAAVEEALPSFQDQLRIAERALRRVGHGAQAPGKVVVHPHPEASFANAMPAYDPGGDQEPDVLGVKWVTGYPTNSLLGLPTINSLVLLNDPVTLEPIAAFEGSQITACRTAAITAISIRQLAPSLERRPVIAALIGAGVQGRAHIAPLGYVLPGLNLRIYDRHSDRAITLADIARETPGIGSAEAVSTARAAVEGADVVITAASFGPTVQVMTPDWLAENVLVVAVDYDTYVSARIAKSATLFLVDEREGYEEVRKGGRFGRYPDPHGTIGDALAVGTRWPGGHVLVAHLGIGLTDVLFAGAVYRRAMQLGLGVELPT